jgi:hypothetical protein
MEGSEEVEVLACACRKPKGSLRLWALERRMTEPGTSSVSGSLRIPRFHFLGLLESCPCGESVAGVSALPGSLLPDSVRQGVNLPMVLRRPGGMARSRWKRRRRRRRMEERA